MTDSENDTFNTTGDVPPTAPMAETETESPPAAPNPAATSALEKADKLEAEAATKAAQAETMAATADSLTATATQVEQMKLNKSNLLADVKLARETRMANKLAAEQVITLAGDIAAAKGALEEARAIAATIPELEKKLADLTALLEAEDEMEMSNVSVLSASNLSLHEKMEEEKVEEEKTKEEETGEEETVEVDAETISQTSAASTIDERFDYQRVFSIFDADGSGAIDGLELSLALTAISEKPVLPATVAEVLSKFDLDSNGVITLDEFKVMCEDPMFTAAKKSQKVRSLFRGKKPKQTDLTEAELHFVHDAKLDLVEREQITVLVKEVKEATVAAEEQNANREKATQAAEEAAAAARGIKEDSERAAKIAADIEAGEWSAERVFAAYDADDSGSLDAGELSLALTTLCGNAVSVGRAAKLCGKFDTNEDGVLDFFEFQKVAEAAQAHVGSFLKSVFGAKRNLAEAKEMREKVEQVERGEIALAAILGEKVEQVSEGEVSTEAKTYVPFTKRPTGLEEELGEGENMEEVAAQ